MNTKFAINVKEFAEKNFVSLEEAHSYIQPELFKLGYHWEFTSPKIEPKHTFVEVLYINKDMTLQFSSIDYYEKEEANNYPLAELNVTLNVSLVIPKTKCISGNFTKVELEKIIKDWDNYA